MGFKPFYVHINHGPGKLPSKWARGATVLVSPDPQDGRSCVLQVAVCSRDDQFCRATGRAQAAKEQKYTINVRALDKKLSEIRLLTEHDKKGSYRRAYGYVYKFML